MHRNVCDKNMWLLLYCYKCIKFTLIAAVNADAFSRRILLFWLLHIFWLYYKRSWHIVNRLGKYEVIPEEIFLHIVHACINVAVGPLSFFIIYKLLAFCYVIVNTLQLLLLILTSVWLLYSRIWSQVSWSCWKGAVSELDLNNSKN